ncbi:MAG TPA: hypothetical protein VL652_34620 [Kutzneria sp.]|nr:hypothetical protein [Kutzneria sp.]
MLAPELTRLAQLHRVRQEQLAADAVRQVRRHWGLVDAANVDATWRAIAQLVLSLVTSHQAEAARGADGYVSTALRLAGETADPAGQVATRSLAGVASDGRTLQGLLGYPSFEVGALTAGGMDGASALTIGGRHLERIVATQVSDAARVATGVAQVNDRKVAGYTRLTTPPSCSRCVVLAGRWYRYSRGFLRHPQCDCVMVPAAEVIEPESPKALYEVMTPEQHRAAGWSQADAKAIADGGDLAQVSNAKRDLRSVSIAGQRLRATGRGGRGRPVRLTPESIYAEAERLGWSRDETIRALRVHGYIL